MVFMAETGQLVGQAVAQHGFIRRYILRHIDAGLKSEWAGWCTDCFRSASYPGCHDGPLLPAADASIGGAGARAATGQNPRVPRRDGLCTVLRGMGDSLPHKGLPE